MWQKAEVLDQMMMLEVILKKLRPLEFCIIFYIEFSFVTKFSGKVLNH